MAICKCSPEYSYQPHSDIMHELQSPHKCLVPGCDCQDFQDHGQKWTDTFVAKSRDKEQ
ncbi:MAG: hypothetical protein IIA82_10575 [Thaumarchaeota archaeon]|nr:hypothetical protein [Nitrososphaerota archaeon]